MPKNQSLARCERLRGGASKSPASEFYICLWHFLFSFIIYNKCICCNVARCQRNNHSQDASDCGVHTRSHPASEFYIMLWHFNFFHISAKLQFKYLQRAFQTRTTIQISRSICYYSSPYRVFMNIILFL